MTATPEGVRLFKPSVGDIQTLSIVLDFLWHSTEL